MKQLIGSVFLLLIGFRVECQDLHFLRGGTYAGSTVAGMVTDKDKNVYLTGEFWQSGDFDPGPSVHNLIMSPISWRAGNYYVSKFDSIGNFLWAYSIPDNDSTFGDILIENSDSGYVIIAGGVGSFNGLPVDFDPGPGQMNLVGGRYYNDVFISRVNGDGTVAWAYEIGDTSQLPPLTPTHDINIFDLAVDPVGNIYLTGMYNGNMDFDPDSSNHRFHSSPGSFFILKLGPNAEYDTLLEFPGGNVPEEWRQEYHSGIEINSKGEIFHYVSLNSNLDSDPGPGTNLLSSALHWCFIQKYDTSLSLIWTKTFDYAVSPAPSNSFYEQSFISDMVLDGDSLIYLAGQFQSDVDFDPGPGVELGSSYYGLDPFYLKMDQNGSFDWVYTINNFSNFGDGFFSFGYRIAPGPNGHIAASGWIIDSADFDPGPGQSILAPNSPLLALEYLLTLDNNGNLLGIHPMTNFRPLKPNRGGLEFLEDGTILNAGYFRGTIDLDPDTTVFSVSSSGGPVYYGFFDCFFRALTIDTCYRIKIQVDSFKNISCSEPGYIGVQAKNGSAPLIYSWNTIPPQTGSAINFQTPGNYTLNLQDSSGCSINTSFFVQGPDSLNAFDLKTNLIATSFRPGFPTNIWLDAYNVGCAPVSGDLVLIISPGVTFDTASPMPSAINGDTLIWNFVDLTFDSLHLSPWVKVTTSPGAIPGGFNCLETIVTPLLMDKDSTNNRKNYCFPITGSYDPNDKQVFPQGECSSNFVLRDSVLTYNIRFQNVGNAPAINIKIQDLLDYDLDLNTFSVVGASHENLDIKFIGDRIVQFSYDSIMLPDSIHDEPNSHGYVMFEVSPKPGLAHGTIIRNDADIFFDFNSPIQTNTVMSTLVSSIPVVDASVSVTNKTLFANMNGARYEWIVCDSGFVDPADTFQSFTPTVRGTYAVIVTNQGCSETSDCYFVNPLGIEGSLKSGVRIYPNPNSGSFQIELPEGILDGVLEIRDMGGKLVYRQELGQQPNQTFDIEMKSGFYSIRFISRQGSFNSKMVIE